MSTQELVEKLIIELQKTLDLDELESKIYLNLLRIGPITASALAKDLNIDRATMYRTVDKLVDRNFISTTLSIPKLCIAIEPETALKITLEKKEEEIKKIKKSGRTLVEKILSIRFNPNQRLNIPTLRMVQGRDNIYSDIAQLIENCSGTVYIATTLEDVSKMYHSIIPEKIKICKKNGGKILLLVEVDDSELIPFVKRFNATEARVSKMPSKGRIVVQKDKQLILSNSSQTGSNSEVDFSISTNAKDMINNIENFCDLLWKSAKPLEMISHKKPS